jgi:hypothetical protein
MEQEKMRAAIDVIGLVKLPVILIGLLGNLVSFVVFSRRVFANYSISVYYRALAISDCFIIYRLVYEMFNYLGNIRLNVQSHAWCKLHYYIATGLSPISEWILVAFSVDKMIHVLGKKKWAPFIERKPFQLSVVLFITLFHCLVYLFVPIMLQLKEKRESSTIGGGGGNNNSEMLSYVCVFENIDNHQYLNGFILTEANLIPFVLMMITTSVTIKQLFKSRTKLERRQNKPMRERKLKDVKFAVNSVVLNSVSAIFQVPVSLSYLIKLEDPMSYQLFCTVSLFLFYLSYSMTFFVHILFNSIFRNEFLLMSGIRKKHQTPPAATTTPLASSLAYFQIGNALRQLK